MFRFRLPLPRVLGTLVLLSSIAPPGATLLPSALAQSAAPAAGSSSAQAEVLFREARGLLDLGRFQEACRLFERSLELEPSPGTLLNLGNCYEQEGDLARALATFERALADIQGERDVAKRKAWSDAATQRRDSLMARVPLLVLQPSPTAGATLKLGGQEIPHVDTPLRLNPGRHRLELSAPQKKRWVREVELALSQRLQLDLPELADLPKEPAQPTVAAAPESPPPAPASEPASNALPWVFLGTGAALGVASVVTGLLAKAKENELDGACGPENVPAASCTDPELATVKSNGETLAAATYVLWAATAVSAGIGVTLLALDSGGGAEPTRLSGACFGAGCAVSLTGEF